MLRVELDMMVTRLSALLARVDMFSRQTSLNRAVEVGDKAIGILVVGLRRVLV